MDLLSLKKNMGARAVDQSTRGNLERTGVPMNCILLPVSILAQSMAQTALVWAAWRGLPMSNYLRQFNMFFSVLPETNVCHKHIHVME